ncbi:eukaryotic translation initiation factor 5 [Rickenella mellea]|uniref:Eukaryotic translation initiation factor 5 n=1 Tax=Rickenella mellea TaxID=50990 RepID=A0A4Y7PK25_9AGAM|nr:eukaryotic translation initiation factor 5 [Rickenella mellea]
MAPGFVNIRRDVDDKFYRYRMPLLLTKIEGKGNGIKTVIPNMADVARALSRPPTYPTKFFGCELGAQTSFDEKVDRYIVNGAHDATRLRELLDTFIDKFVLCGSCKNPETELILTKTEEIIRDCKACGQRTSVDMRHKLTTFILRNPPKKVKTKKGSESNAPEVASPGNGGAEGEEGGGAESDDELTKRIKSEAAELSVKPAIGEDGWSVDTSPEAVKARVKTLETSMQASLVLNGDDDSDEDSNSPYGQIGIWAVEKRADINSVDVFKKAQELGIEKKHRTVQTLVQTLFTEDIVTEIPKFAPVFTKMMTSEKHQKALLGGIERFVGVEHLELLSSVPKILMEFYQADILQEDVIKQWGTHVSKKYVDKETCKKVRKASEPFLKWLDEADDDDEDDDEE